MQDRIEKEITVKAALATVWRAVTDYREFGAWFRVALDGPFAVGVVTTGKIMETGHEGMPFWVVARVMQTPRFVFDWPCRADAKPAEIDVPGVTTQVEFLLEPARTGTRIRLTEAGFAKLPPDLAVAKFRDNDGGWAIQMGRIKAHVDG